MYEIFEQLLKKKGVTAYRVAKETRIPSSTFTEWKNGNYSPKQEKLQKIADYFGVTLEYLTTGVQNNNSVNYYIDDDARELAQFMSENPDYKVLFDASRKIKKQDIQFVKQLLDKMATENDDTGC